jgi:hypothetical protein
MEACLAQTSSFFSACGAFPLDQRFLDQSCLWVPWEGTRGEGSACTHGFECARPADPRTFVHCTEGACVHYSFLPEGAACAIGPGGTRACDVGLYCDIDNLGGNPPFTGVCVKASVAGTSCDQSFYCGYGSYCDTISQSCQPRKPPNALCADPFECESNICTNGVCTSYLASQSICANCPLSEVTNAPLDCDPLSQACGATAACDLGVDGRVSCFSATGTGGLYAPCQTYEECGPGLGCYGSRCTRPCCDALEHDLCGPNGGCTLQISDDTNGVFLQVCSFRQRCDPWLGGAGCSAPETQCGVTGNTVPVCQKPSGNVTSPTLGKACTYANDCDDSQYCDGTCRWLCKVQDFGAPDTGTVGGAPGQGGCPSGETCERFDESAWLGHCTPSST